MLAIVRYTWVEHQTGLLGLAVLVCIIGSLSFFLLLQRSRELAAHRRGQWLAIGAFSGGIGVWATHFVAMLAHRHHVAMHFDVALTLVSVVKAVAAYGIALCIVRSSPGLGRCMAAAAVMTVGIAAMHFTGMAAVVADGHFRYAPRPVAIAAAAAWACLALAFALAFRLERRRAVALPAALAVAAVLTLHFTAMYATTFVGHMTMRGADSSLDRGMLATVIVLASGAIVLLTGGAVLLDRTLTDLRGLTEATLEGLAIVHNDRILETNHQFACMVGVDAPRLVGRAPDGLIACADGLPVLAERAGPVEATVAGGPDGGVEINSHVVEYRGRPSTVLAVRDLAERRAAQRQIEHMARHDALTDLANRTLLDERLAHALARARRDGGEVALLAIDLDRFKAVNDIFGHAAGDEVLRRVARVLAAAARETDTVARLGGDEFTILQVGAAQPDGARALAERVLADLAREMDSGTDPAAVGASIGAAVYPTDAADAEHLRRAADVALYRAKAAGRGTACLFDRAMDAAQRERRALEQDLRTALAAGQFHLAYQPLVATGSGQVHGYEALLRWTHPLRGAIPPDAFVPIAEETGSIVPIGQWVLREACRAAAGWSAAMTVAVNLSPVQFRVASLPDTVARALADTGLPGARLELEITETALIGDRAAAMEALRRIKRLGVRIVMDDFGTGYSSLANLQSFPIDKIKIDRSFVAQITDDPAARSIVRAIVGIARSLHLPVVAEGVETEAQRRLVLDEGCPQAQGFLFGRPRADLGGGEIGESRAA